MAFSGEVIICFISRFQLIFNFRDVATGPGGAKYFSRPIKSALFNRDKFLNKRVFSRYLFMSQNQEESALVFDYVFTFKVLRNIQKIIQYLYFPLV